MLILLQRVGALADKPGDDDETRLRYRILIFAGLLMCCGGLLWGSTTAAVGLWRQSLVPYGYVAITAANFWVLWRTKRFAVARMVQVTASLVLPFAFQWVMGGFHASGGVMVWAMMCLVGSLAFGDTSIALRWLGLFVLLTVVSGIIDPWLVRPEVLHDRRLAVWFLVMNFTVVTSGLFGLTFFFVRQRQVAIQELAVRNQLLAESQQALVQSEKLAALGQLVAGVAHELNTPLGAIKASVENLEHALDGSLGDLPGIIRDTTDDEKAAILSMIARSADAPVLASSREERQARRRLRQEITELGLTEALSVVDMLVELGIDSVAPEHRVIFASPRCARIVRLVHDMTSLRRSSANIRVAADRSAKIVFALKSYAHPGGGGVTSAGDLGQHLDTVLTLYHNKMKHGVEVTRRYADDVVIEARHDQLNQVWTNLVHNAIQAMDLKGSLDIEVTPVGDRVEVRVTDSGPGIPPDVRDRIFEPFFTTKPVGEGSGLGLSICRDIVEHHQGRLTVDSRPGRTRFTVSLPRVCRLEEVA